MNMQRNVLVQAIRMQVWTGSTPTMQMRSLQWALHT